MKVYTLRRQQQLPISAEGAWAFFSSAGNLAKITPPEMGFTIVSTLNEGPVYSGMLIEYRVKPLLGISMKWVTEITGVDAPHEFTDRQLKGPYAIWEHTHCFKSVKGGVEMTDEVKYALPLGWLGNIAHELLVKSKLKQIFDFRTESLKKLFGEINEL
jgi:ligand-binding SRPBCC domain-containing protein